MCTGRIETHLLTFEANQCDRECRLRLLKAILQSELPDQVATSEKDAGSPTDEVRDGLETIAQAYAADGDAEKFGYYIEDDAEHILSPRMWRRAREWFAKHL